MVKIDIDILLAYFQPNKVLPSIKIIIPHHDLISAIKGRICTLDERAIVIFDMCSDDFQQAARLVQDMRSGKMPANESIALPDLV